MADDNVSLITDPELLAEEQEEANSETNNSYTKKVKVFVASKSDIEGRISRYMQRHGMGIKSIQYIGSNTYAVVLEKSLQQSVYVFKTKEEFDEKREDPEWMLGINVGDVVYIVDADSPDYWYAGGEHGDNGWVEMVAEGYTQSQINNMLTNEDGDITLSSTVNGERKITHATKAAGDGVNSTLQKIYLDKWGHVKGYQSVAAQDIINLGMLSAGSVNSTFGKIVDLSPTTSTTMKDVIERVNAIVGMLKTIKP